MFQREGLCAPTRRSREPGSTSTRPVVSDSKTAPWVAVSICCPTRSRLPEICQELKCTDVRKVHKPVAASTSVAARAANAVPRIRRFARGRCRSWPSVASSCAISGPARPYRPRDTARSFLAALQQFAKHLHAAAKIHSHRFRRQPGAGGDFRSCHALHQAQQKRLR